jgi:oligopeptide/dipeptide ABC transporter ATP-binding protein
MYRGELMEEAPAADFYKTSVHPYTRLLFDSVTAGKNAGEIQVPSTELKGCAFAPRCPLAKDRCRAEHPEIAADTLKNHRIRCFFA